MRMNTTSADAKDAYNSAVANVLRGHKDESRISFPALAAETGINIDTLKRLINGHRAIHMGNFIAITTALGVDPGQVMTDAAARVEKSAR